MGLPVVIDLLELYRIFRLDQIGSLEKGMCTPCVEAKEIAS